MWLALRTPCGRSWLHPFPVEAGRADALILPPSLLPLPCMVTMETWMGMDPLWAQVTEYHELCLDLPQERQISLCSWLQ